MRISHIKRRYAVFAINHFYCGTHFFSRKRSLLRWAGYKIGEGTKVVGPFFCTGELHIGKECWIGREFCVEGNGVLEIGDNCDIAPQVTVLTGSHHFGSADRRAGEGVSTKVVIGSGTWIGARATIVGHSEIGSGCVIGACAMVKGRVPDNTMVGGVPAKPIMTDLEEKHER